MEDPDLLVKRIEEAWRYVPMENLALSPQCGFASTAEGNLVTEDRQWDKLKLVVETARRIWNYSAEAGARTPGTFLRSAVKEDGFLGTLQHNVPFQKAVAFRRFARH